jgi:hypothetical protein
MPADPATPRIVIVRDPEDTPDTGKLLTRIHDVSRGVLVVRPAPGTSSPTDLALAVLAALGKHLDGRPVDDRSHWWDRARSWTVGHRIEHLVVDRAHTLPAELIHRLLGLAQAAQATTLWFVDADAYRTTPALTRLGTNLAVPAEHLLELANVVPGQPRDPPGTGAQLPALIMPSASFLTFRYACQRQLPVEQARLVDTAWQATFDTVRSGLLRTPPYDRTMRPADEQIKSALPRLAESLSVALAGLLYPAGNSATALLRLRAAEVALFRHGLLLRHRPGRRGDQDHLHCPLTPIVAAIINRAVSTNAAAAAVLHLLFPLITTDRRRVTELRSWRVDDVHPDGSKLMTGHGAIPVPPEAQPVLRARLHTLHADGRTTEDTPLIDHRQYGLPELARQVLAPLGLTRPGPDRPTSTGPYLYGYATAWMTERGFSLHALADLDPPDNFRLSAQ